MGLREHLEKQRAEDYELLKEYENTLRTEIDPRLKLKWKEDIKEVKQRIRECEEELGSLSASSVQPEPVTPYPSPPATSPSEPEQEVKPPTQQLELQKHREQEEYQPRRSWLFVSRWNKSEVIALSSLMVAIVAIIVGVAIPEVRCFVGLQSESCPTNLISKATGVDYTPLRNYLAAGKWKEADQETWQVMLHATDREKEGWLRIQDIINFSCEDLRIIDQLWLDYSYGKFGFSVQKDIYQNLGGKRNNWNEVANNFGTQLGWWYHNNNYWMEPDIIGKPDDLTWYSNAPRGQLPFIYEFREDQMVKGSWGQPW